ncbi:gliding motility-associated C-terminal domain-containing protein [Flavobacterium sp. CF108]|uniref:gliding motility-associated C-terminal domain-containing protein n=1 Tax=unclassified Flavobacterium TaxID=196869 RepID=UPI0008C299A5|nr:MULTISPECIES: gliding motility-associated C-terminal domain-containing protein [unclassified Flavobacterium]SEO62579.1 gliding motility-associated C-terminal domain-containing protein [Flavobacterium sp. fv08]SHI07168.1 gliding motility-associated C-terminal domain-containing protein [Flavobacterium sp. CF108]
MKNNTLYKVNKQNDSESLFKQGSVCGFLVLAGLLACQESQAQFYNTGDVKVEGNTIMSVYEDYDNTASGKFTNDGDVYIFKNWNNDGEVDFTAGKDGKTTFEGDTLQNILGSKLAGFQNLKFDNSGSRYEKKDVRGLMPFLLSTSISVNKNADFSTGIIDAITTVPPVNGAADFTKNGIVIFEKDAVHENASDVSFVDGRVQKLGKNEFEFPVGNEFYFRPSYHAKGDNPGNIYTTQYFFKNSDDKDHSHSSKEREIQLINNQEYWTVTKDKGAENIVLTLTMDSRTTPSEFFNLNDDKIVVIVRWDGTKWVNEGGEVDINKIPNSKSDGGYTQLLTARVNGYGMFTMAIVDKTFGADDGLVVYNAVSPNGDGINDTFHIKGLEKFPDNTLEIYNRWGVKVYDAKGYNESDVMFAGYSDGRATINRGEKLPTGTYFYILKYNNGKKAKEKAGYLYINNQ